MASSTIVCGQVEDNCGTCLGNRNVYHTVDSRRLAMNEFPVGKVIVGKGGDRVKTIASLVGSTVL